MVKRILIVMAMLSVYSLFSQDFIRVDSGRFLKGGKPYHYVGANFWYGMNLGAYNKPRLLRELNRLDSLGVKNLRIMGASEGSAGAPWRMQPAVQTAPGVYDEKLLEGLDFLLAEMKKRDMVAVVCLNNFWPWSGGFSQYVSWANGNEPIPYPPPAKGGDWKTYQNYSAQFYSNQKAMQYFRDYLSVLINRVNTVNHLPYKQDATIMAWQLANEPEGSNNVKNYRAWLYETAQFIKQLDSNHLVSIGSEGKTPSPANGTDFEKDHNSPYIDYCTFHLWIQNWGWYDPEKVAETYPEALKKAADYIQYHVAVAQKLNKPLVLEEFGISRDDNSYSAAAPVTQRDKYYDYIFNEIYSLAAVTPQVSGVNFWAWGGEGRPAQPKAIWKTGDDFIGDPPHEYQGWYSVYDTDTATEKIISDYALKMQTL